MIKYFIFLVLIFSLSGCSQADKLETANLNLSNLNTAEPEVKTEPVKKVVTPAQPTDMILDKVLISDVFNDQGSVATGKNSFQSATEKIAVSAYIFKAKAGLKVTAQLQFLPTKEIVGPAVNEVTVGVDIISNFLFTQPSPKWPTGEYEVIVTLDNGQTQTVKFNISE